jgi:hypothetical protein
MFLGPKLESMLLSGEAQFKNAPLGYASLNTLTVERGLTIIITGITLEPFLNYITPLNTFGANGSSARVRDQDFTDILERLEFSFQVSNQKINQRWQFRNESFISSQVDAAAANAMQTTPGIKLERKKIDCFLVTDETVFFFFTYPDFKDVNYKAKLAAVSTVFSNANNFPGPPTGVDPTLQTMEGLIMNLGAGGWTYLPLGIDNTQTVPPNPNNVLAIPVFPGSTNGASQIVYPVADNATTDLQGAYLPSLPLMNVSYIQINRNLSELNS